jgi:gliding motility-associated-like protein
MKKDVYSPGIFRSGIMILYLLACWTAGAQTNCVTTASSFKFSPPDFQSRIQYPDLLSFTGKNNSSIIFYHTSDKKSGGNADSLHVIKLDGSGNVIWAKTTNETFPGYTYLWSSGIELSDSSIILYGLAGHYDDNSTPNLAFSLIKLNTDGGFAWQKEFSSSGLSFDFTIKLFAGDGQDFFLFGPSMLFHMDGNGVILWQKETQPDNSHFQFTDARDGVIINHKIFTAANFYYYNRTGLSVDLGVVLSDVDYETGDLNKSVCYQLNNINPDYDTLTIDNISLSKNTDGGLTYTSSIFSENGIFETYLLRIDKNLTSSDSVTDIVFNPPGLKPGQAVYSANCSSGPNGNLSCIFDNPFNRNINYFSLFDANQNIILQRKISLPDPVNFNSLSQTSGGLLKSIYVSPLDAGTSYIYYSQTSPDFISSSCSGEDTAFLKKRMVAITSFPWSFSYIPIGLAPGADIVKMQLSFAVPGTIVCEQSSDCDSIKILGPRTICNKDDGTIYQVYKNAECLSKTNWTINSDALKSSTILSDSSLSISFNKSWSGWMYANLAGCNETDSIFIHSISKDDNIDLGADTSLCQGNTLHLSAGKYSSYLWQDGSGDSTLMISQAGTYSVQVSDNCDFAYADTINVYYYKDSLNAMFDTTVCSKPPVSIFSPVKLTDYEWYNQTGSLSTENMASVSLNSNSVNEIFLSGHTSAGCKVNDTIRITYKDCTNLISFPNAFSPNGDGINDLFRPVVHANLNSYELSVYNNWGELVFQTKNVQSGWDGRIRGQKQDTGAFVWFCKYQFEGQPAQLTKGTFVLVR